MVLGIGCALVDVGVLSSMGTLVDTRHTPVYGTVFAVSLIQIQIVTSSKSKTDRATAAVMIVTICEFFTFRALKNLGINLCPAVIFLDRLFPFFQFFPISVTLKMPF